MGFQGSQAAARATAIDTPRIAFAPNLPLLGVPSRAIIASVDSLLITYIIADDSFSNNVVYVVNSFFEYQDHRNEICHRHEVQLLRVHQ